MAKPGKPIPLVCHKVLANCSLRSHEAGRLLDLCLKHMALDFQDPKKVFQTWKIMNRILQEASNLNELNMANCQEMLSATQNSKFTLQKELEKKFILEITDYPVLASAHTDKEIHSMPALLVTGLDPNIAALKKIFAKKPARKDKKNAAEKRKQSGNEKQSKKAKPNPTQKKKKCKKCKNFFAFRLHKCPDCYPVKAS